MIPVYKPRVFTESAISALQSGWISSQGEFIAKTTEKLRSIMNVPYAILMNNGTSATHMLYRALRFKHPEIQKVYVPNNVFVAVWNAALYEFPKTAIHVLDMNPFTLNMRTDEEYLKSLSTNSAVVVVHNVGNVVNVPRLKRIRPDLVFLEDNCEGMFGRYEGILSGSSQSSLCSCVSFFANKTITSGEGGAFFTHDQDVYDFVYKSIHHGLSGERYIYHTRGYNYRMTNIQAALLYDQLYNVDSILSDKLVIFKRYRRLLDKSVVFLTEEEDTNSSLWMFSCGVKNTQYSKIETFMNARGIDIRPFFYDISRHRHLSDIPAVTIDLDTTFIMLPSYPDLSESECLYIASTLNTFVLTMLDSSQPTHPAVSCVSPSPTE